MLYLIISALASFVIATIAYAQARNFVTRRLRYVDAVQNALAPVVAGIGAGLLALPLVAVLPFVGMGTAVTLGLAVGLGVAAGAREIRGTLPRY